MTLFRGVPHLLRCKQRLLLPGRNQPDLGDMVGATGIEPVTPPV